MAISARTRPGSRRKAFDCTRRQDARWRGVVLGSLLGRRDTVANDPKLTGRLRPGVGHSLGPFPGGA